MAAANLIFLITSNRKGYFPCEMCNFSTKPAVLHCPGGEGGEFQFLVVPRKADTAGKEHWRSFFVPAAVFAVTYQGEATAGKLHPDLVGTAGMEPNPDQGGFPGRQPGKFQSGSLYTGPLTLYHKNLVLSAVFEE